MSLVAMTSGSSMGKDPDKKYTAASTVTQSGMVQDQCFHIPPEKNEAIRCAKVMCLIEKTMYMRVESANAGTAAHTTVYSSV